ncbi:MULTISPECIES: aldo/keto reductase [unclassified Sphingobium]|uniref:aldo/keto reductase n=1 Tax=unclassified Sphingobium TaxID=2611147 RepID=UPI0035A63C64
MRKAELGKSGLMSSVQGFGAMGMSEFYGAGDEAESLATLARAVELGINHLDTSDLYGKGENELLLGRFLKGRRREDILLASKFGVVRDPDGPSGSTYDRNLDNSPAYARACCEASLKRLGTDYIDLYYVHRYDPSMPIEEVIGGLVPLVEEGKIRAIGLSEVSSDLLRRAASVHPIAALQTEYSLFARAVEDDILPTCRSLGIAFLAYGPLGRGILAGKIRSLDDLEPGDLRRQAPMYAPENLPRNLELIDSINAMAAPRGATAGQIALAWLHAQPGVFPLPGTKRVKYLEENVGAAAIVLTDDEMAQIEMVLAGGAAGAGKWSTTQTEETAQ